MERKRSLVSVIRRSLRMDTMALRGLYHRIFEGACRNGRSPFFIRGSWMAGAQSRVERAVSRTKLACRILSVKLGNMRPSHTSPRPPMLMIRSRFERTRDAIAILATDSGDMLPSERLWLSGDVSSSESKNSLRVVLGLTIRTSMRSGASSTRMASDQPRIANLAAQYSLLFGTARCPRTEPTLRMAGRRPRRSSGSMVRVSSTGAKKSISMTRRNRSLEAFANEPIAPAPALLIRTSTACQCSWHQSTNANRWRGRVMSPGQIERDPGALASSRWRRCSLSSRRAVANTWAPDCTNCKAMW